MWFGDLVTMTWWDDLWLNESFAEWAAHWCNVNATRYTDAWTTFANLRKAWAYRQDQLPSTHPIAADMVDLDAVRVNFDGITYAKGASALRQLVAWVGEEEFLAGVRNYFAKHAWGNTELRDLLVELEATSGRDLSDWTAEWLQTSGVNLLRPAVEVDADGDYTSVVIEQEPPSSPEGVAQTLRSHRIALGLYDVVDGSLVRRDRLEIDVVGARTEVPAAGRRASARPAALNDDDLTFAKIRLDERSWATAAEHLGDLVDPAAPRAHLGRRVGHDPRCRGRPPATSSPRALGHRPGDRHRRGAGRAAPAEGRDRPVRRAGAPGRATSTGWPRPCAAHAEAAEPGSDHQLAFTRAFVPRRPPTPQLDVVAGLLDGSVVWDGLAVDTDLRWFLLQRLVATGRLEEDRDRARARCRRHRHRPPAGGRRAGGPADRGGQGAGVGRDRRPHRPAERDPGRDDRRLRPARPGRPAAGLPRPLLRGAAPRLGGADHGDGAVDHDGAVPDVPVDDETIAATDAFLAGDLNSAVRRLVSEGRDGVLRAAKARARDAASRLALR